VLFGSTSTGTDHAGSDVDVLVELDDPSVSRLAELAGRLSRRLVELPASFAGFHNEG
jgi:predicted nucleotidyltransferase